MKLWNRFWIKPEELPIDEWCQRGPRRNADFMLQGQRDKQWAQSAQLRVSYLFAHGPRACAGLSSSLNVDLNQRGCQLCPHKKKENKSLFKISRELQFGLCKLGKPHSSPPRNGKGRRLLWGGEGGCRKQNPLLSIHRVLIREGRPLAPLLAGLCYVPGCESALFWSPDSVLLRFLFISFLE